MNAASIAQGRRLQILDHRVHRIDSVKYSTDATEQEMVVTTYRHFTIIVGLIDPEGKEAPVSLKAELLYENGDPVEQLAGTTKDVLDGQTVAIVQNGQALFRLRLTVLSIFHNKRRFCIRFTPVDQHLLINEPNMIVISTPMKSITKIGRCKDESEAPPHKRRYRGNVEELLESHSAQLCVIQQTLELLRKKL